MSRLRVVRRMQRKLMRNRVLGFRVKILLGCYWLVAESPIRAVKIGRERNVAWRNLNHFITFVKEGRDAFGLERPR